jgi:predicted phage terminase large subunit-like protein
VQDLSLKEVPKIEELYRELCNREFWEFCKYIAPDFYLDHRTHLKTLCNILQAFYERKLLRPDGSPFLKLIINLPRRHGKSRTLELFSVWMFGKNPAEKIITVSYNETLSVQFSKSVRDKIQGEKIDPNVHIVTDIFPELKIQQGSGAAHLWALEGQHLSYLGGSPGSTLTGMGASVLVIDDLIKKAIDALNERILQEHYDFYNNTLQQTLEEGHLQIINFTRWATTDLIGRLLKDHPGEWYVHSQEVMNDKGEMLCDDLMSVKSYYEKKKGMMKEIFQANYHQKPMDIEGRLYKSLKTYTERPTGKIKNYTDTADEGNCYLCSIDYIEYKKEAYIINVLYTQEGMEKTEPQTAEMFFRDRVNLAMIESNNGGKGFARAVANVLNQTFKSNYTVIKWFHQTENKVARIKVMSSWVQEHVYFPADWGDRWPIFCKDILNFNIDGKGQYLDGPDVLTGIAEQMNKSELFMY